MEEAIEGKDYSFPQQEEKILDLWDKLNAFEQQLKLTEGKPEYIFYDGPPFATGLPHYGHILAGTLKDIVTRYASMTGHHVSRRFGWDCHGLPVEYEIDKKLNIKSRDDVLAMGIDVYNEECRSIVMRYSKEWEKTVKRLGRWIDFENDYKTLDPSFMESVWWVFKQLFEKDLVYKGFKVMPFSTGCSTPLSNFEAGLNYKDVNDPAVMVSFPLVDDEDGASMVAWTTTPWTLPSNLALCVNPAFTYVKVKDPEKGRVYIVAESRLAFLPGAVPKAKKSKKGAEEPQGGFQVIGKMLGKDLVGKRYTPLFPYFAEMKETAFRVISDGYVTDDSGTGVVHQAPAFGEDDYRVCISHKVIGKGEGVPCPVDLSGRFVQPVADFEGRHVKEADKDIIAKIKEMGRLVDNSQINHSYPFCWRSDTPLIYRAVPSWFVKVESFKDRLLHNNSLTHWVPSYVKEKRFHNWLENAHDWAISRSRFWGTPLPIWTDEEGSEVLVVGSIEELEKLTGAKVSDLHRHFIDDLTITSPTTGATLHRVDEVFDCWFESGSMPYGQLHYPFENKELFEANFPADFVAEGLDQTRGWFYTLMVLSTALFDKPAFKNLVCNGLVLAADGKKMSKRLQNYPDPNLVINKYGSDALRLYLINSPVVRAETLRFKEEGVFAVVKDVFLPWYNAYRFLVQNILRLQSEFGPSAFDPATIDLSKANNVLDLWIGAAGRKLTNFVREEMGAYRLYTVVPFLVKFIDNLTNIYVRYNRKRLKGSKGREDCTLALASMYHVLLDVAKVMAPFTPFLTEAMYQNLRHCLPPGAPESVHFIDLPPSVPPKEGDERIQQSVERMQAVIELGRTIRERRNKALRLPLQRLVVVHPDEVFLKDIEGDLLEYVSSELNVNHVETCSDPLKYCSLRAEPDWGSLGKRLGKAMGTTAKGIKELDAAAILRYEEEGVLEVAGQKLEAGDIKVMRDFKLPVGMSADDIDAAGDGEVLTVLDLRVDSELMLAGLARELVNRFQKLRKKAGLTVADVVEVYYGPAKGGSSVKESTSTLEEVLAKHGQYLRESLGVPVLPLSMKPEGGVVIASEEESVGGGEGPSASFTAVLAAPAIVPNKEALLQTCGGDKELADAAAVYLASCSLQRLHLQSQSQESGAGLSVQLDGKELALKPGQDYFLGSTHAAAASSS